MPKALRFEENGGPEALKAVDVPEPLPGRGEVVVRVVAAGINPGEGAMEQIYPAHFPEGSDLAGVISSAGAG
jgi:NADPH:quinone reductase-like Zn-dependent oxidoreductase